MRKSDEIKGLRNQLDALMRRNAELREQKRQLERATAELQTAMDAVMITTILTAGEEKDGAHVLTIPRVNVRAAVDAYEIAVDTGDETHVLTVTRRRKEAGCDGADLPQ